MDNIKLRPEIMIVAIDCTDSYSDNIKELCERIADVYFYNKNEVVHCCEITPSYWLEYVGSHAKSFPQTDEEREKIQDLLDEANVHTEGTYYHCHVIENLNPFLLRKFDAEDIIDMGDQDLSDYVREYIRPDEFCGSNFFPWER